MGRKSDYHNQAERDATTIESDEEIKDLFRSKVRVAPSISFESFEYIEKIQQSPMSRKTIKFLDLR